MCVCASLWKISARRLGHYKFCEFMRIRKVSCGAETSVCVCVWGGGGGGGGR